tara:strand:- start:230089 stop:231501 length:1413 start_codon:yes stop_codon:yes gene_type:complete
MTTTLYWFRQDLRVSDNPALLTAIQSGDVLPVYILDDENAGQHKMGAASRVWLHYALESLNQSLDGKLLILKGNPLSIIPKLMSENKIQSIFWNRCYEPWRIGRDKALKLKLEKLGLRVQSFNGSLLWEPWENLKDNGDPYKVFTPYFRKACKTQNPRKPLKSPANLSLVKIAMTYENVESLNLLPSIKWHEKIVREWDISEEGAVEKLHHFLKEGVADYKEGRNFPAKKNVSRLSPYLHFGQISPNEIWHTAKFYSDDENVETFCTELGWREFSYNLLYHFPELKTKNLQAKFDHFPWDENEEFLKKWQRGKTGYPIVDAGMRELWQTGFMHNRVRMVVASFLVKNLRIHWHQGEKWFWDCLIDADHASNSASWQWVAGSGADAAPYFRVFNPITQGERFDPEGAYITKYVPELAKLPIKYLFNPWEAPKSTLAEAGIELGSDYPLPMVDVKASREAALSAYAFIKLCG